MSEKFDFEAALKAIQSGQAITGKDSVLAPLVKQLTEAALEGELDSHLADDVAGNRRNGKSKKRVKSTSGEFELETPRDRAGTFEPKLVKKHQRTVSDEIEAKILSMFGLGMSYSDIAGHVQELYGISVSTATISTITDKLIDEVKAWQCRPLDSVYPFVWLDAIHYRIRDKGRYQTKGGFPNDDSLLKLLYMGVVNASKKWTMPIQNWNLTVSQLTIFFEGRLDAVLDL